MAKTELYISAIKKGRRGSGKAECGEDISDKRYARVGVGCVLRAIIRNSFGYIAISIVSNRRASFCVVAKKWLKRNYNMSSRKRENVR